MASQSRTRKIKSSKKQTTALYEPELRDQLDAFVVRLFERISNEHTIAVADLLKTYKRMTEPSENHEVPDGEEIELEYVVIDGAEYLYHALTRAVYSYSEPLKLVGWFDPETESVLMSSDD